MSHYFSKKKQKNQLTQINQLIDFRGSALYVGIMPGLEGGQILKV
jgi:hypothetical protein|tara:strand:- start:981 stop:1115 length:135 start_codon:yes stop_codon:yes gene_type:complete